MISPLPPKLLLVLRFKVGVIEEEGSARGLALAEGDFKASLLSCCFLTSSARFLRRSSSSSAGLRGDKQSKEVESDKEEFFKGVRKFSAFEKDSRGFLLSELGVLGDSGLVVGSLRFSIVQLGALFTIQLCKTPVKNQI